MPAPGARLSILAGLKFGGCTKRFFTIAPDRPMRVEARKHFATFYHIRCGTVWVEIDDHRPILVREDSILVLNRWYGHTIRTAATDAAAGPCEARPRVQEIQQACAAPLQDHKAATLFRSEASIMDSPFKSILPYVLLIEADQIAAIPRFKAILELYQMPSSDCELQSIIDTRLDELVATILLSCGMEELQPAPGYDGRRDDQRIKHVLFEMHEHLEMRWSVSKLSARANLSRSGFIDRFKAIVGETPMTYLTRIRIERAANILAAEALPISTIAYRVGYSSEAAFHRAFKKIFNEGPGDYRRRLRQQNVAAR